MIRIEQLRLGTEHTQEELLRAVERAVGERVLPFNGTSGFKILKRSLDCRHKPDIYYSYSIGVITDKRTEERVRRRSRNKRLSFIDETVYEPPVYSGGASGRPDPVIIGDGPAGLFCAYILTAAGLKPIVLERGDRIDVRAQRVDRFWREGILDTASNVQFGEGGAGTFSDGKLNSTIKDRAGRIGLVLDTFIKYGAKESIAYEAKPHLGTDMLKSIITAMRLDMEKRGCSFRFNSCAEELILENKRVKGVTVRRTFGEGDKRRHEVYELKADTVVVAVGHSAADTFRMLLKNGLELTQKDFAMGFRVIHPQELINRAQYGEGYSERLPAADYKLTNITKSGRSVYSFCMCPGGYVVNASSRESGLTVNGMSYSGRASGYANSAIVTPFTGKDFGSEHPLAGVEFQQRLEKKAYELAGGRVPVQSFSEFKERTEGSFAEAESKLKPQEESPYNLKETGCIKGECGYADLSSVFGREVNEAITESMEQFDRQIKGFAGESALLAGIEARTSSPVRIVRDKDTFMSNNIYGVFPCGEGAGYAGGIMSAAVDGIKTAEKIIEEWNRYCERQK